MSPFWNRACLQEPLWATGIGRTSWTPGDVDLASATAAELGSIGRRWLTFASAGSSNGLSADAYPPILRPSAVRLHAWPLPAKHLWLLHWTEERNAYGMFMSELDESVLGLKVWDGSALLAWHLQQRPELVAHRRVCCLGEGVGLVGCAAACFQPAELLLTDGSDVCVKVIQANLAINGLQARTMPLKFGKSDAESLLASNNGKRFEVIIAADVIYSTLWIDALFETVDLLMCHGREAMFMMLYTRRTDMVHQLMLLAARKHNFQHESVLIDTESQEQQAFLRGFQRRSDVCEVEDATLYMFTRGH